MLLCGSLLRPPASAGPDALVRLAGDAGFDGIAVDGGCTLASLPALIAAGARAGLPCPLVFGPLPEAPLPPGKRLPHLSAVVDKEERLAAIKVTTRTLEAARALGVTQLVLELGPVTLALPPRALKRHFARVELDEGEPGHRPFRRLFEERREKGPRLLDACRAGLEPVLLAADRAGATVALIVARSPWGLPSPREAQLLLQEFRGSPLGLAAAPGRRAVLERLGLAGPPERWTGLDEAVRAVYATDAVGLEADLLPGLGEADLAALTPIAPAAPHVISGRADTTPAEAAAARALVAALRSRPARSAAS